MIARRLAHRFVSKSPLIILSVVLLVHVPARTQHLTAERIINADKEPGNWMTYGGNYSAHRYSALNQITRENVKKINPVWAFQTGKIEGGLNATPLVVDGVMYLIGSYNRLFALNAATGERLWHYFYQLPPGNIPYTPGTRGIAVGHGMVYLGTLDNHLVAINAKTGKEVWDVEVDDVRQCGCNITSAPLLVKDKVIVGGTGGETAHRGYLTAYDAKTGRRLWRWYTIPGPGEPGFETWSKDSWKFGGGPTWLTGSYDPELNLVYWGVGNPSSDFYGENRKGDNLFTNCVVALNPDTGELKWFFQEIPHDMYDFDSAYECVLIDVERAGKKQKLLVHTNKSGFVWVLDRVTGRFVTAWPGVETYNWAKGIDQTGKPYGLLSVPPDKSTFVCPQAGGGRSWNHASYSPRTGWFYNNGIEWCGMITPQIQNPGEGEGFFGGSSSFTPPKDKPASAHVDAYDPFTGQKKWTYKSRYPVFSSLLTTGGDLLFAGDFEGRAFALDAVTGERLWSFNTGSGISGGPISYAVNGRQYVAIPSGLGSLLSGVMPAVWPETKGMEYRGATLFVFALPETGK